MVGKKKTWVATFDLLSTENVRTDILKVQLIDGFNGLIFFKADVAQYLDKCLSTEAQIFRYFVPTKGFFFLRWAL